MIKKFKLYSSLGLCMMLITAPCISAAAQNNDNQDSVIQEMAKDKWLERIKQIVPEPICKGFMDDASISARLKEINMSYEDCVKAIPSIAEKCQQKFYADIPDTVDRDSASKWGRKIGECIGAEFAINHLYADESAKESKPEEQSDADKVKNQSEENKKNTKNEQSN